MADVPNTITSALALCVVLSDTNRIIFGGSNASERIANDVFNNYFNTCIDMRFSDLDKHRKTYSYLTVTKFLIRLRPRTGVKIRYFIHWVRYMIRMREAPAATPFSTEDRYDIIERYNTHIQWMIYT